jgi:hypothetical protein
MGSFFCGNWRSFIAHLPQVLRVDLELFEDRERPTPQSLLRGFVLRVGHPERVGALGSFHVALVLTDPHREESLLALVELREEPLAIEVRGAIGHRLRRRRAHGLHAFEGGARGGACGAPERDTRR